MQSPSVFPYSDPLSDVGAKTDAEFKHRNGGKIYAFVDIHQRGEPRYVSLSKTKGGIHETVSYRAFDIEKVQSVAEMVNAIDTDLGRDVTQLDQSQVAEFQKYLQLALERSPGIEIAADGSIRVGQSADNRLTLVGLKQILDAVAAGVSLTKNGSFVEPFGITRDKFFLGQQVAGVVLNEKECEVRRYEVDLADVRPLEAAELFERNSGKRIVIAPTDDEYVMVGRTRHRRQPVSITSIQGGVTRDVRSHAQLRRGNDLGVDDSEATAYDLLSSEGRARVVLAVARDLGGLRDPRFLAAVESHLPNDDRLISRGVAIDADGLNRQLVENCLPNAPQLRRYFLGDGLQVESLLPRHQRTAGAEIDF